MSFFPFNTDSYSDVLVAFGTAQADSFGRGRTSHPETLFNAFFQYDAQPLLMQTVVNGSATATKIANTSAIQLSTVDGTIGHGVDFQSKGYWRYEPGKSLLIAMTGIIGGAKANVRSQIGYYDANDGIFFDQNNGMNVTIRTSTSGSPVDAAVAQASWNIDTMSGSGLNPSGVTLDFTKGQIFVMDLQWLGSGRVRFGFNVNGQLYYCHQIQNANLITLPYMNTACLPVHWAIHNTGAASGATTMQANCASVIAEGGNDIPSALPFSANNGTTTVSAASGARTPILSIQVKTTFNSITNRSKITPNELTLSITGANNILWELIYNGTLTGASFASVDANSGVNKDVAASAISGGTVVASGYASTSGGGAGRGALTVNFVSKIPFTLDAAGAVADIFTVCASGIGGSVPTVAEISWTEER